MITIKTARLLIRNFVPDDWRGLQAVVIDKESSAYAVYDYPFPTSDNAVQEITGKFAQSDDFLAVCEQSSHQVIGYLAVNVEAEAVRNLGYAFHSAYHRQGYAGEACIAVIDYAFRKLDVVKFTSGTANLNHPSYDLLVKLGFRKTGESVTSFRTAPDGKPVEFTGSSFLLEKSEWLKQDYAGLT